MIERQDGEDAVVGAELVFAADRSRIGGEVGLRQQHALGHTGGARGVHEERRRIGARRRMLTACSGARKGFA